MILVSYLGVIPYLEGECSITLEQLSGAGNIPQWQIHTLD